MRGMVRVLVVGAGNTGALCAFVLRKHLPTQLQCQIVVWEKSRGCGGRMATSHHPENKNLIAELGGQYIEQRTKYMEEHKPFYDELLQSNVLKPLEEKIEGFRGEKCPNYVAVKGLSQISKHFFSKSGAELCYNQKLESLRLTSEDIRSDWVVWEAASEKGQHDHFDAVILTLPVPQILDIQGVGNTLEENQVASLKSAEYSSRFAVGLFYEPGTYDANLPYVMRYISNGDIIRFFSVDHAKRGVSSRGGASIVAHTSAPFGIKHLEEDKDIVGQVVVEELNKLIPGLPEPSYVKHHKWRYSQVTKPVDGELGCMVCKRKPLLVLAGDGFTHSNFDGCIQSALKVEEEILKWVGDIQENEL